jgi:hypothetical protein
MIESGGATGMERFWGSIQGSARLARLGPTFFPDPTVGFQVDDNGVPVLPQFQTPWYRIAAEGRKRVKNFYLSYDARVSSERGGQPSAWRAPLEGEVPAQEISNLSPPVLDIGYLRSPQDPTYTDIGNLPATTAYSRYRLPVRQQPYGIAFQVKATAQTTVLRVFDLAIDAYPVGRSNL